MSSPGPGPSAPGPWTLVRPGRGNACGPVPVLQDLHDDSPAAAGAGALFDHGRPVEKESKAKPTTYT